MITLITSKRTSQKAARYRGTVLVETAIVIVLLLMFLLGIIGFGLLFWRAQLITTAARHGARIAVRYGAQVSDVETSVADYLNSQKLTYTGPLIPTGIDPGVGNPVTVTVQGTGLDPMNLRNFPLIVSGFPDSFTASVTMAKEGPSE